MSEMNLIFNNRKTPKSQVSQPENPWLIAIIDDDEQVHSITKMVLRSFQFDGRGIQFLSAYSAKEGIKLFQEHDKIAICLLDVVMESDNAGLELVKLIRNDMGNRFTRIVLRTGQPGQAPEEEVIACYDINDYKEKTELTSDKLRTVIYSCLRAYRDIISLENTRIGLEQVIDASSKVFSIQFIEQFAQGILSQVTSILNFDKDALYGVSEGLTAHQDEDEDTIRIVSGIGRYRDAVGQDIREIIPHPLLERITHEKSQFNSCFEKNVYLACYHSEEQPRNILYLNGIGKPDSLQTKLLDIYSRNVLVAFENMYLKVSSEEAQRDIVYLLGGAVETRSNETGEHLKRVALISQQLALLYGMSWKRADLLYQASPLHDLGKIGIPDSILNKPAKLDPIEWELMKTHSYIGYQMLKDSTKKLFKLGATIALEHHERWDGSGYPDAKKGQEISIEARIVSIADVFDALMSKRCYKDSWKLSEVFQYMRENAHSQFDPGLIDLLINHQERFELFYQNSN